MEMPAMWAFVIPSRNISARSCSVSSASPYCPLGKGVSWWDLAQQARNTKLSQNCPRLIVTNGADDFTLYKRSTVLRRISRRMQVARRENLEDYLQYLRENDSCKITRGDGAGCVERRSA